MYKRVLLCIPPFPSAYGWPTDPHRGIGYLSTILTKNNIENEVLDLRLGYKSKDLVNRIHKFKPDLVGITMMSYRHDIPYNLIEEIKNSNYKIVVGGPHVSTLRKKILEECGADFGVKLEGEYTLLELCQGKELAEIRGLIYREGDRIIENEDRPFIKDLDGTPFPKYEKFELEKYSRKMMPIMTSRGCPYQCIYCPIQVCMGREYRMRSAENVVAEVKYWYERGYREFDFRDDNFALDKERIYRMLQLIENSGFRNLYLKCGNGVRADLVNRDLLRRMFEIGFREVALGVEAGTTKILRRIKKGEDIAVVEKAIKDACEIGYDVTLYFMVGHPEETPADFEESIKLALKYPVSVANFYNIIPFPGTELYDWVKENNYFIKQPEEYLNSIAHWENEPIFATPEFPYEERKKALIRTKKISRHLRRRDMERKLQRYGFLAKPIAFLVYSSLGNKIILKGLLGNKTFKRILTRLLERLNLKFYA